VKMFRTSKLAFSVMLITGMLFGQNAYGETNMKVEPETQKEQSKVEIPELRTENTKTYKTDQPGVYVRKVFNEQTHYQSEDGQFYEIVTDLTDDSLLDSVNDKKVSSNSSKKFKELKKNKEVVRKEGKSQIQVTDGFFHPLHVPFNAELPKNIIKGYSIGKGKDFLSFIPQNANSSKGSYDSSQPNTILYENAWESTHIKLSITSTGVKEEIVLLNAKAPNSFTFEVKGTLDRDMKSGELTILPAWLEDSTGTNRTVNTSKRTVGSKTYLDLTWEGEGLIYPVTIDPSVISQKSSVYNTCSNNPNSLNVGLSVGSDQNTKTCMSFVQFSNFQLPKTAQVTNVDLKIYGYNSYNGSFPVTVRQLFEPITMQLNYNNRPRLLDSKSVTANISYTPKYETYRWSNLGIDTSYFRTGFVQLGMYYTGNSPGFLAEALSGYGGTIELEIAYTITSSIYQYDLNGRLSSIRSKTGHLLNSTFYDKNGNTLKRLAPYYTLLENHDFNEGNARWLLGPNMNTTNEMSMDGNGSLMFSSPTATSIQSVTQAYSISVGSSNSFTLAADILDNTTSGKVYVTWKEYNYYYGVVASGSQLLSTVRGQWSRKSVSFTTSSITSWITVQIIADTGTKGTAYVDFVNLTPGIKNGGFNAGETGWSKSNNIGISIESYKVKEGANSLRFNYIHSPIDNTGINSIENIPVNPGISYNFSSWFYNDLTTTNGKITILLMELPEEGPPTKYNLLEVTENRGSGTWFSKSLNFITNSQTRYISMQIMFSNAAGNAYVDQMQLVPN